MQNTSENLKTEPEENERVDNQKVIEVFSPVDAMVDNDEVLMTLPIGQECSTPQDFQKLIDDTKNGSKFWSGGEFRVGKTGNWHFYDTEVTARFMLFLFSVTLVCSIIFNLVGILKVSIFDLYNADFFSSKKSNVLLVAFSSYVIFFQVFFITSWSFIWYVFSYTIDLEFIDVLSVIRVKKHRKLFGCLRMPRIWPDEVERSFNYTFIRDFVLVQPAKLPSMMHRHPYIAMITKSNEEVKISIDRTINPLSFFDCSSFLQMERFYGFRAKCEKVSLLKILLVSLLGRIAKVPQNLEECDEVSNSYNRITEEDNSDFLSIFPAQYVRKDLFPETKTNKKICRCEFPLRSEPKLDHAVSFAFLCGGFLPIVSLTFFYLVQDFLILALVLLFDVLIDATIYSNPLEDIFKSKAMFCFVPAVVYLFLIFFLLLLVCVVDYIFVYIIRCGRRTGTRKISALTFEEDVLVQKITHLPPVQPLILACNFGERKEKVRVRKISYEDVRDFKVMELTGVCELRVVLKDGKEVVLGMSSGKSSGRMRKMAKIMKKLLAQRKFGDQSSC